MLAACCFALVAMPQGSAPPPPAPAATRTITGTCTGLDAAKAPPARVSLWRHDYQKQTAELVRDVRAEPDGSFTFADVPWLTDFGWGFGFFTVHATHGDHVGFTMLRGIGVEKSPCAIKLAKGDTLTGRVQTEEGKSIANAEVRLLAVNGSFFADTPPPWITHTGADGSFAIRGIPAHWQVAVSVLADRCAQTRIDAGADAEFLFELAPGAALTGKVVDEHGKPQVRVRVCTQGIHKSAWITARTDDQGVYTLRGLPGDAYNVWADPEDATCVALDSVAVVLGETTAAADIVVMPGGFFVGSVVDAATGKPVQPGSASDVAIYGPSRPRSGAGCHVSPIAPDGTFRIRVAPGSNYVYLRADAGFAEVETAAFTLDVAPGEEKRIQFRVRKTTR